MKRSLRYARPDHLAVIGGGPIGVEMAQAHARLGIPVTLIEGAPTIMPRDHQGLVAILKPRLESDGISLIEGHMVTSVGGKTGAIEVNVDGIGTIKGSHLLVATGRKPNLTGLIWIKRGLPMAGRASPQICGCAPIINVFSPLVMLRGGCSSPMWRGITRAL